MNDWFEWNGVRCTDYGMHVLSQPSIVTPKERVTYREIPGVPGSLSQLEGDHVYDDITLACVCVIDSPYELVEGTSEDRISKICGWLQGGGNVTFANRPEGFYTGRLANQVSFDKIVRGNPHMTFQVQFRCKPFFRLFSGCVTTTYNSGSVLITNPGNIPSKPLLRITGTGEGSVMIGSSSLIVTDFSGLSYINIDCESEFVYKGELGNPMDPLVPLNTRVIGEWLRVPVEDSFLTITGEIASVVMTPRWWSAG